MKYLAIIFVGLIAASMVFVIMFTLTAMLGGLSYLIFASEVNVVDGAMAVRSYSAVITLLIYFYLVHTGKIQVISEDDDDDYTEDGGIVVRADNLGNIEMQPTRNEDGSMIYCRTDHRLEAWLHASLSEK